MTVREMIEHLSRFEPTLMAAVGDAAANLEEVRRVALEDAAKCDDAETVATAMERWAELPLHKAEPLEYLFEDEQIVRLGDALSLRLTATRVWRGTSALPVDGIDYNAWSISQFSVACYLQLQHHLIDWPATKLFEPWERPMTVAKPNNVITLSVKNISATPQRFAVRFAGMALREEQP